MSLNARCPHCRAKLSDEFVSSLCGRLSYSRRKTPAAGQPKKLRPCQFCKLQFGAREMRDHLPLCPKKVSKPVGRPKKVAS